MKNFINDIAYFLVICFAIIGLGYSVAQAQPEPDYTHIEYVEEQSVIDKLTPTSKKRVERVIEKYYEKTNIIRKKVDNIKPAVKKFIEIKESDIEIIDKIAIYIKKKEGFSAKAYKDNTQYSNGYGTQATSKTEVITKHEANIRLYKHIKKVIIPSFKGVKFRSIEQIYSAIDFSYNVGQNRFKKYVVTESGTIDCSKMMAYNKIRDKNGNLVYSEGLAQRRFENFLSCTAYDDLEAK